MSVAFVAHAFYYTAMLYLMSRLAPDIPIAQAWGFTAQFGKNETIHKKTKTGGSS